MILHTGPHRYFLSNDTTANNGQTSTQRMSQDTTKRNTISILKIIKKLNIIQEISLEMYFYTSLAAKIIVANWLLSPHSARNVIVKAWIRVLDTINKLLLPIRNRHLFGRACCSMSLSYMKVNISVKCL